MNKKNISLPFILRLDVNSKSDLNLHLYGIDFDLKWLYMSIVS